MKAVLYYIHDPMCSWCWGYRPAWDALQLNLPQYIKIQYVAGGLAPDSDIPMPSEQQDMIKAHWHTIEKKLGTQFNYDFWKNNTPRRSTYNACRAVIAAHNQGYQVPMVEAIQRAYYLQALNPSNNDVLIGLAKQLSCQKISDQPTLDLARFTRDFTSQETQQTLHQQIQLARELTFQGFPSLVLECNGARQQIPVNYHNFEETLAFVLNAGEKTTN